MTQSTMPFDDYSPPFKGMRKVSKQEFRDIYDFSTTTFKRLFNKKYYELFKSLGYDKNDNYIPPIIVNKFIELYGEPL